MHQVYMSVHTKASSLAKLPRFRKEEKTPGKNETFETYRLNKDILLKFFIN